MSVSDLGRRNRPLEREPASVPAAVGLLTALFGRRMKVSAANCRNRIYLAYEKCLASPQRGLRILISEKPEWETEIRQGFDHLRHTVQFGAVDPHSFAEFDVVVPLEITELLRAHEYPELVARNPLPIPSKESVLLCDDKLEFGRALVERGFGEYVPEITQGLGLKFPYILKRRISTWGVGCSVIRERSDEWRVRDQISDPEFYCQMMVPGVHEFATHLLVVNGRIVKSLNIMYEFENQFPIKGQDRWLYRVIHRCPYLALFRDLLSTIGFEGLCCVNYKVVRGCPYILEINPRFGGSLAPYFFSFLRHLDLA